MKFHRSIFSFLCLLLIGWALGYWAGSSAGIDRRTELKVATIGASPERDRLDHLTDEFTHSTVHEAIVTPVVSHQVPPSFFAIIPAIWVLIREPRLMSQPSTPYYFFAYFRRLFGHQIAINAP
ncbi:hypothetical protein LX87_02063 [Larkinella arboricola]|uniref:Uncharacterized protein n=1 Tax=Larkinella arboricola TaxID=643671 RepID=A0A327X1H8_LARAB|nr:hypothetical protein [Larkinella arboricola]RAK00361.1 hypothetical protein LX87_02063 [Larkinella arboricola]